MILKITAIASLALPSAVSVSFRAQSHLSQRSAFLGNKCPQYGHGIMPVISAAGSAFGASVYSTLNNVNERRGTRQAKLSRQALLDSAFAANAATIARWLRLPRSLHT